MWVLFLVGVCAIFWAVLKIQGKHKSKVDAQLLNKLMNGGSQTGKRNLGYNFDIVGEQSYQKNLAKIAGEKEDKSKFFECYAKVSSEPFNKYDKNAIKVEINGLLVGYISKVEAVRLAGKVVNKTVPAVINGGWVDNDSEGSYGVKLAINNIVDLE